jgi:hypothetical protein
MIKQLNESQLCDLITKATKQVLKESFGLDPEVGEDEFNMEHDYLHSPEGEGMPVDSLGDDTTNPIEQEYDDFFTPEENPAEEEFDEDPPDFENAGWPYDSSRDLEYDQLLESKNKVDMEEKQNKLLTFITENWDNHANNLIK